MAINLLERKLNKESRPSIALSKRGQERVTNPVHLLSLEKMQIFHEYDGDCFFIKKRMALSADQKLLEIWGIVERRDNGDFVMGQLCYRGVLHHEEQAFVDVLCQLAVGKTRRQLVSLTSKEIENFLRDDNRIPAYDCEKLNEDQLIKVVHLFISALLEAEGHSTEGHQQGGNIPPPVAFTKLTDEIRSIELFFNQKIRPVLAKDQGGIELLYLPPIKDREHNELVPLVVQFSGFCSHCPSSKEGTRDFIQKQLNLNFGPRYFLAV